MFWSKKEKAEKEINLANNDHGACCHSAQTCPRCGYPIEGLMLVCPRCREELPRGCSGNCSACGK
ncbi:hypothetical protein ACHOLT_10460 [Desulfitobacterium sp. Sab5]|uniref:hypothetical protein n=1 Tax=Desulfitobacterium nosdiversum TaxID=3375356 RepID=UPI003CEAC955